MKERCGAPDCRRVRKDGCKTCGDRSCVTAAGRLVRDGGKRQKHRCKLAGCRDFVPRRAGEAQSDYRRRLYCRDEHRIAGRSATLSRPPRTCAREGCGNLTPRPDQEHCENRCAALVREAAKRAARATAPKEAPVVVEPAPRPGPARESKRCECGCLQTFERPSNLTDEQWQRRRFVNLEHRRRGGYARHTPDPALANGRPGAARAGNRRAPSVAPSRDRRPSDAPPPIFADEKKTPPRRFGAVPVIERRERVEARPRFGLTRRRIA